MKTAKEYFNDMLWFEVADISFNQHYKVKTKLNTVILTIQLIALIIGVIVAIITKVNVFRFLSLLNLIMMFIILMNDYICDKVWQESKSRRDDLLALADAISDDDLTEEDIHLIISGIKGYKINYSDLVLQKLVYKWLGNLSSKDRIDTKVKDCNGVEYGVGDIVFNSFAGDLWYVDELSDLELKNSSFTNKYVLKLNGSDEEYVMELDEPTSFEIMCTKLDRRDYIGYIIYFMKMYKVNKREIFDIDVEMEVDEDE